MNTLTVESGVQLGDSATPEDYRSTLADAGSIARFMAQQSGKAETGHAMNPAVSVESRLLDPANIPFRPAAQHFFSDMDGRARYGILGTPGGDLGEFILALAAMEELIKPKTLSEEDVYQYFEEFLEHMANEGKHLFYHGTDEAALGRLAAAAEVGDPLSPATDDEVQKLIEYSVDPRHVGCRHLRMMIEHPLEYKVAAPVVEGAIKAFYKVYFDSNHPSRPRLLHVVLQGQHTETAVIVVNRVAG